MGMVFTYPTTFAAWTLIILLSEMLENMIFSNNKKLWKKILKFQAYSIFQNESFKIN